MPLDKIQLAALRQADSVVFRHTAEHGATIEATKAAPPATARNPFPREVTVDIPCESAFREYRPGASISRPAYTGFDMIQSAQYCPEWLTIARLLQPGDALTLRWERNAWCSPALGEAGFIGDRLMLEARRGKHCLTFHVRSYIGPDSLTRMVRIGSVATPPEGSAEFIKGLRNVWVKGEWPHN
jgi:hypothetical protein